MRLSKTLSGRLTLYTVATFTALLLVCFTLLYLSMNRLLAQRMDQDLLEDIAEFSQTLSQNGVTNVSQEINKETANGEHETVFLMLLDSDLNIVFQSDMTFWEDHEPDFSLVQDQLHFESEPVLLTLELDAQDAPTRIVYGRLSPEHVLILGESMEDKNDITELLVFAFSIIFLIAIPVASLLVWLVTRRTVSGIRRVSEAANGISQGNLDVRVNTYGQLDEVQTLADTFDAMAARIQNLIHHMREMTDNIAHDLRSPLGRIRLTAESLLQKHDDAAEVREAVTHTVAECDRLIQMIDLSLDVAEAEAGVLTLDMRPVNLTELTLDTCDFFEPAIELKRISFRRSIDASCRVMGDSNSLQRLMSNLLDNALKYTPEGGEISVSARRAGDTVEIDIADTGIGIPAKSIDHVFDRFYRADTSRGGSGCGLGLSYAHAVAKAHKGDLSVRSSPGSGTVFTLRIQCIDTVPSVNQRAGKSRRKTWPESCDSTSNQV